MELGDRLLVVDDVSENLLLTKVNLTLTLFKNTGRQFPSMVN
ncbi:hypothetical protein PN467_20400 [Microcystis aeruginosa CS-563/04]|nr:hypothetical protein [Microcystis aeruginosa]MDB9422802.1 hypothetical protein [Microcystis aeruginosa CS-563/04]